MSGKSERPTREQDGRHRTGEDGVCGVGGRPSDAAQGTRLTALGSTCETQRDDREACAVRARTVEFVHTLGQTGRGFNMLASLQPKN